MTDTKLIEDQIQHPGNQSFAALRNRFIEYDRWTDYDKLIVPRYFSLFATR